MKKENLHGWQGRYSDEITGTISLLKNDKPIRRMRFNNRKERKGFMAEWMEIVKANIFPENVYEFLIQYDKDV